MLLWALLYKYVFEGNPLYNLGKRTSEFIPMLFKYINFLCPQTPTHRVDIILPLACRTQKFRVENLLQCYLSSVLTQITCLLNRQCSLQVNCHSATGVQVCQLVTWNLSTCSSTRAYIIQRYKRKIKINQSTQLNLKQALLLAQPFSACMKKKWRKT